MNAAREPDTIGLFLVFVFQQDDQLFCVTGQIPLCSQPWILWRRFQIGNPQLEPMLFVVGMSTPLPYRHNHQVHHGISGGSASGDGDLDTDGEDEADELSGEGDLSR